MTLQLYIQYKDKIHCVEIKSDATADELLEETSDQVEIEKDGSVELLFSGKVIEDFNASLADLGICNESRLSIIIDKNEDIDKIIEEYSEDALEAYYELFGYERNEVEYDEFQDKYFGHFDSKEEFIDYVLELNDNNINIPYWVNIDYENTWDNIMVNFSEENGYYFQN